MPTHHITVHGTMPGMNEIIAASKKHYAAYAKLKKQHTENVIQSAEGLPEIRAAHFAFDWYAKDKRRDPDNIASGVKFLLDGLVEAGVLPNDGWKEVLSITHTFHTDKAQPRVEVSIYTKG